jgi:hypothetical protein
VLHDYTRRRDRPVYLWLYYCFPALQARYDGYRTFPGFFARTVLRQMPMYHRAGIRGMFIEHSSEFDQSHLGDVPELYLTLKLADDPKLDGQAAYEEFFRLFYGSAAAPMRRLYEAVEDTYSHPDAYPDKIKTSPGHQHQTRELAWGSLGTPERMAAFARHMADAKRLARTDLERTRVGWFETGIWRPMSEGAAAWAASR